MGLGKYDLIGHVLEELGVNILYRSLNLSPGRSTIFGVKGQTMFFSLAGLPPVGNLLFNELVRQIILTMQGKKNAYGKARAVLTQDIVIRKKGLLNLKSGICAVRSGFLSVCPAGLTEPANATILIPAHRRLIRAGEKVIIHFY